MDTDTIIRSTTSYVKPFNKIKNYKVQVFTTRSVKLQRNSHINTYLENKKGSCGPLFEELQEIWHHHLSTIGAISLFCSSEFGLLLVATPGLKVAHWVIYGKRYWKETFLLFVVKYIADLLKLKR